MSRATSIIALTVAAAAVATYPVVARTHPGPSHWVHTWTSMPQLTEPHNLPPAPFTQDGLVLADATRAKPCARPSAGGRSACASPTRSAGRRCR